MQKPLSFILQICFLILLLVGCGGSGGGGNSTQPLSDADKLAQAKLVEGYWTLSYSVNGSSYTEELLLENVEAVSSSSVPDTDYSVDVTNVSSTSAIALGGHSLTDDKWAIVSSSFSGVPYDSTGGYYFKTDGSNVLPDSCFYITNNTTNVKSTCYPLSGIKTSSSAQASLTSITVTPTNQSITSGAMQQFTATGTYSDSTTKDITTSVTWGSSNTGNATISTSGLATAQANGTATVTATSGDIYGTTTLTIVPKVTGWSSGAPMPTARYWAASAVVGNDIYVIGGEDSNSNDDIVEKYNALTNSWTSLPDMPYGGFDLRAATVDGKVYIFWGGSTSPQRLYQYDPVSGNWTRQNDMPDIFYWMGAPAVVNNKIYLCGGYDGSNYLNKVLEYDPSNDTWTTKASMPTARWGAATAVYNNKIYVMGGVGGNFINNEVYDPATDIWQSKADLPFNDDFGNSIAGVIAGKIYIVNARTSDMAIYAPLTDSWTTVSGLNTLRSYVTGETVNGKLYVIGGHYYNGTDTIANLVDIYTP